MLGGSDVADEDDMGTAAEVLEPDALWAGATEGRGEISMSGRIMGDIR